MNNDDLYEIAESANIRIDRAFLPKNKSLSVRIGNENYIGIDRDLNGAVERTCLAHELGHCETCSFYDINAPLNLRCKQEYHANKWAVLRCVPLPELIELIRLKYQRHEIAEYFGVTEQLIQIACTYYFDYKIAG